MRTQTIRLLLYATLFLLANPFLSPSPLFAEGFRVLDHGAAATGQGAAFSAQADNPSAVHYNPAGMTQLEGIQFSTGTLLIGGSLRFNSDSGPKVKGSLGSTVSNPPPSTLFLTAHLPALGLTNLPNWTVGVGLTSPFALQVKYPDNSLIAPISTMAALPLIDIKPTLAYKVNDYIAIGGGLDIYTFADFLGEGHAEIQQNAAPGNAFGIPAGTNLEGNGRDTALGFNASLLWTPFRTAQGLPQLNAGFVYRHGADLDLHGDFLAGGTRLAGAQTTIELPDVYTWAIAAWPIRNLQREWKVEVDVEYADWTDFEDLNLNLSNGATISNRRNYGDAWVVLVGTEYVLLSPSFLPQWDVSFRSGYVRSETPVRSRTLDPSNPDSDFNAFSVGLGFLCHTGGHFLGILPCTGLGGKAIGLDLAYQVLLYEARNIKNNQQPLLNGTWDTTIHVGAVSLRLMF
ncbi:MAG: outer membrane protein transport protein [Nitrospirota bacterium]|nr:outer membrane protein transport protein [Nitrospirota bacterium]MDH5587883.1 outer membrane protein transport protein [Nitrospirota bacterium]MDH5774284.1 outer membrane protein transport protein [Nitrospirota bacterium]